MISNRIPITHIIWDLSGTLFRPQANGLSPKAVEDLSLLFYMWSGKKTTSLLDKLALDILDRAIEPHHDYSTVRLHSGEKVPTLICKWLAGQISSKEATTLALKATQSYAMPHERDAIEQLIITFFDPISMPLCMKPINITVEIVALCAKNPNIRQYALSNWDRESFQLLHEQYKSSLPFTFIKREDIMISGNVGALKPQPEIYHDFLKHFKLDPHSCIFIDDQIENVEAAKKQGIRGYQINIHAVNPLLEALKDYKIIS